MRPGEGVICNGNVTDGSCGYIALGWYNTAGVSTLARASQSISTNLKKDSAYMLSLDARAIPNIAEGVPSGGAIAQLIYKYADNTTETGTLDMSALTDTWSHWKYALRAAKDLTCVTVKVYSIAPDTRTYTVDNVALNEYPFSLNKNTDTYCPGQLIMNGSFEDASAINPPMPAGWSFLFPSSSFQPGEGRSCSVASSGSCSYVQYPMSSKTGDIQQKIQISGKKGDKFTLSADALVGPFSTYHLSPGANITLYFRHSDLSNSFDEFKELNFTDSTMPHWHHKEVMFLAPRDFDSITIEISPLPFQGTVTMDSLCLQKVL